MSLVVAHLNGEAYPMRNAMVTVLGQLLMRGFEAQRDNGNTNQLQTQLRTKQAMLDTLVARAHDVTSYVRSRVLQTWTQLCEEGAIPLPHLLVVTELAVGRLKDKASVVRKSAMQLLFTLVTMNPFGAALPSAQLAATLEQYSAKLEAMAPPDEDEDEVLKELDIHQEGEEGEVEEEEEGSPKSGRKKPKAELDEEEEEYDAETQVEETQASQGVETPHKAEAEGTVDLAGGMESMRALVASLSTALNFTKLLARAVKQAVELLTSKTTTDVTAAIDLLVLAHQFDVDGASPAIQRMLSLIFSRDTVIKDAVVAAARSLYLEKRQAPRVSAARLVAAAMDASLGTLAALEALLVELVGQDLLPPKGAVVRDLWVMVANKPSDKREPASIKERRAALTVLSMAAGADPEVVHFQLGTLLEAGFGEAAQKDALTLRAACVALKHLVPVQGRRPGQEILPAGELNIP
jgi:condensin complex subunit 1